MKRLIGLALSALLIAAVAAGADQPGKQKKNKNVKTASAVETRRGDAAVAAHVVFGPRDIQLIRTHYATRYRNLPPGLQKKVARGGSLPPGWRKKLEPFPVALERRLPPLPAGYSRGVIDAHAVIYNSRGMIIDVAVLF